MKECYLYDKLPGKKVCCKVCSHYCTINDGSRGICGVRENNNGNLCSLVYEKVVAMSIDPIEKKPLYHFLPGSKAFSVGTVGCNFGCLFCQNADISFPREEKTVSGEDITCSKIVDLAREQGCKTIAYTYNEPIIFIEMVKDAGLLAHEKGIKNILVTNGYMTEEVFEFLKCVIDGMNIDLKSFSDDFYTKTCRGKLQPVLDTIERAHEAGVWVEVTTLVVPGENDSEEELTKIAKFIVGIDKNIPWHISRFHPMYKMSNKQATSIHSLKRAYDIGKAAGLKYVYMGNVGENAATACFKCGAELINRDVYEGKLVGLENGKCFECGTKLGGVFE